MGQDKRRLVFDGSPALVRIIETCVAALRVPPMVVVPPADDWGQAAVKATGTQAVIPPDAAKGMAYSLRAGLAAAPDAWDAVIIALADMPFVGAALLGHLAAQGTRDAIIVPTHEARYGNPVLWGRDHWPGLMALEGDTGGRALFASLAEYITEIEWPDDSVLRDIDTPEDYNKAYSHDRI